MCVACRIAKIVMCNILKTIKNNNKYYELEQGFTLMHVFVMCINVKNCSIFDVTCLEGQVKIQ